MNSSNLILNVAEKPSVAKTISNILSGNTAQKEVFKLINYIFKIY